MEIQYFINSTDKAVTRKQLVGTSIVHIEVTFMFILSQLLQVRSEFCRARRNQSLPALLGKCLQKLMLCPVYCIISHRDLKYPESSMKSCKQKQEVRKI